MRQRLCRRLEELEKVRAAAEAIRQASANSVNTEAVLEQIRADVEAWHADPKNQEWLAAQPPEYLHNSLQQLKAELEQIASGYRPSVYGGGF